ncbi:MAG: AMP-binding protein [Clostridiales bacterium]|nr:AMP-binding protein [Clostridiales bacterium]MDY4171204.1 AMP-binding protein [Evtepia sp.]
MNDLSTRYIHETFGPDGQIIQWSYDYPENFNYGYDIMDVLGTRYPNRLAMLWRNDRDEEVRLTFGQLKDLSTQAANLFQRRGLKKGDVLMTSLRTHWTYWVVALAAHKLGLILSPVYYRLTQKDFVYRMQKASVRCIVTCQESRETLLAATEETGVCLRFSIGGGEGFEDLLAALAHQPTTMDRVETRWDDPLLLYFTSGTTGEPKGVLHNHAYPLANHWGARYMQDIHEGSLHFATGDTGWEVVSGTKFYGQWLHLGALLVYDYDRFPPEKVLACLEEVRATGMMAQPTVYRMLTEVGMDKYDLSSITNYAVGGEKLSPDLARTVKEQTGHVLYEGYAQSETNLIAAASKRLGRKEGSVGKILPKYHVEILAEDGSFAPPGQPGEIVIVADKGRPPEGLMTGYLQDEEATRRLWDGMLFHTGDMATRDEEGFLFFLGRSDGMIKTKGYRVSPVEIEAALSLHPAVYECLATGEPDQNLGQRIKVYVVPAPGCAPSQALLEELMAFHNDSCAGFQKIRELVFVDSLAHNANGKIIRGQFRNKD